jgi:hypothetical protein
MKLAKNLLETLPPKWNPAMYRLEISWFPPMAVLIAVRVLGGVIVTCSWGFLLGRRFWHLRWL